MNKPSAYRAPTWSWASVDSSISSFAGGSYSQPIIEIEIVNIETTTSYLDLYNAGQVLDGCLKLKGLLKGVDEINDREKNPTLLRYDDNLDIFDPGRKLGFLRRDFLSVHHEGVVLLSTLKCLNARDHAAAGIADEDGKPLDSSFQSVIGLALIPRDGYFERIGLFDFNDRDPDSDITNWFDDGDFRESTIR